MAKNATKDMTTGSPMKLILQFGIPLFFGMLFQQFYNMMDTVIVGKFLGVNALAAVGATGSINFMVIGFCMGVCNGFAIPVAQQFGAGDYRALRKYVANSVWLSIGFAGAMTVAVCALCRQILTWMNTPADIMGGAYNYIFVIFLGIPVIYLYNLLSGIILRRKHYISVRLRSGPHGFGYIPCCPCIYADNRIFYRPLRVPVWLCACP